MPFVLLGSEAVLTVFSPVLPAAFGVFPCPRSDLESPNALLKVLRVVSFEDSDGRTLPISCVNLSASQSMKPQSADPDCATAWKHGLAS